MELILWISVSFVVLFLPFSSLGRRIINLVFNITVRFSEVIALVITEALANVRLARIGEVMVFALRLFGKMARISRSDKEELESRGEKTELGFGFFIIKCILPMNEAEAFEGDIEELYTENWLPKHGNRRARIIARWQCVQVVCGSLFNRLTDAMVKIRRTIW